MKLSKEHVLQFTIDHTVASMETTLIKLLDRPPVTIYKDLKSNLMSKHDKLCQMLRDKEVNYPDPYWDNYPIARRWFVSYITQEEITNSI